MIQRWMLPLFVLAGLVSPALHADNRMLPDGQYVTVKDGHLSYNGQRKRFWGTCFCVTVKRSGPEMELMMDRIADAGFNAIRLNMSGYTFASTPDADKFSYKVPETIKDSKSPMDRLDYAIYAAKKRGMFFWLQFDRTASDFKPGDYDLFSDDGTRNRWNEAIAKVDHGSIIYFYDRAGKVYMEFAKNILQHVNPYTGKRYADEEAIALWEMMNEYGFIRSLTFGGDFTKTWPQFLKDDVQHRWNEWLIQRYKTDDRLKKAWGSLSPGESLTKKSVAFGPLDADVKVVEAAGYQPTVVSNFKECPYGRAEDILRFMCFVYNDFNQKFIKYVRSLGQPGKGIRVVPIAPTGSFEYKWIQYYSCNQYDFVGVGIYGFAARAWTTSKTDPFYPFTPYVNRAPWLPQPTDITRPAGKPYLIYECGDYHPNPYTIEFPMYIAANLIWQDGDGAFWFYFDDKRFGDLHTDEDYLKRPLAMPHPQYSNAGLILGNDEVNLATLKSVGELFLIGTVSAAPNPVQVRIGKDLLFNRSRPEMGYYEKVLRHYAWRNGVQLVYDPDGSSKLPPKPSSGAEDHLNVGKNIAFDWKNNRGTIRIDAPTAKAQVGFSGPTIEFVDTKITGLNRNFSYVGIVAEDGRPLAQSQSILITLTSASRNTGFKLDPSRMTKKWGDGLAEAVVNPGTVPIIVDRVSATIEAPWLKGKIIERHNFLRDVYAKGKSEGTLSVSAEEPMFYIRVKPPAPKTIRTLLVAGNSITWHPPLENSDWTGKWGMAASRKENDFAHQLQKHIADAQKITPELIIENFGDGTVVDPAKHARLASLKADLYVIEIGDNLKDTKCSKATLGDPYEQMLKSIKRSNPDSLIICASTWGGSKNKDSFMEGACARQQVPFVRIDGFIHDPTNRATTFKHKGVAWHPSDAGMKHIAEALWDAIHKAIRHTDANSVANEKASVVGG